MRQIDVAHKKVSEIRKKYLVDGKKATHQILSREFNKAFKKQSVQFQFSTGNLGISGNYNPVSLEGKRYNIFVSVTDLNTEYLYNEIYLTLIHEFRHGYQARKRNHKHFHQKIFDTNQDGEWYRHLIDKQEIDAYAAEAAESMRISNKSWVKERYQKYVLPKSPKHYKRFLKKMLKNLHNK